MRGHSPSRGTRYCPTSYRRGLFGRSRSDDVLLAVRREFHSRNTVRICSQAPRFRDVKGFYFIQLINITIIALIVVTSM